MRRIALVIVLGVMAAVASAASAKVLLVGSYKGTPGQFSSIQAAINAAKAGDWILIGPGDYKTTSTRKAPGRSDLATGILITKGGLHIRGMNRNAVIVDGTRKGRACNGVKKDQNFGPNSAKGRLGLNGILIFKAHNVWVQNLTVCNFLGGAGDTGNEIWWNGNDRSGTIGGYGFEGSYLNATNTFYRSEKTAAKYGIFSSNWVGGTWDQTYASNFNDSGYYIGACQQACHQTVDHAWGEFNALGYSGSNSGGWMLIENSQFDNNEDGFDTNSQNGDNPPPQNGACPAGVKPPVAGAPSCWVFTHNYVHNNNNPNVPALGSAAAGPVGTGMSVSGGRSDTIMNNRFANNDAWGVIFVPFLDNGPPCTGGTPNGLGAGSCLYDEFGDAILNNTFTNNGGFHHPSNGDFAQLNFESGHPTDCFRANTDTSGTLTSSPANLETMHPACNGSAAPANANGAFLTEVLCDSQVELSPGTPSPCPNGQYPRRTKVVMHALPKKQLKTMPNPCAGVPKNAWCK